jgi:hypothetical protein
VLDQDGNPIVNGTSVATIQSGLATASALATVSTAVNAVGTIVVTISAKLGAITGSGINTVLGYFRALANKAVGLTPTDLTAGGATFDNTTASLEAVSVDLAGGVTVEQIDEQLSGTHGGGAWGAIEVTTTELDVNVS